MRSVRIVALVIAVAVVLILGISEQAAQASKTAPDVASWWSER
jgi:hypothetical protein